MKEGEGERERKRQGRGREKRGEGKGERENRQRKGRREKRKGGRERVSERENEREEKKERRERGKERGRGQRGGEGQGKEDPPRSHRSAKRWNKSLERICASFFLPTSLSPTPLPLLHSIPGAVIFEGIGSSYVQIDLCQGAAEQIVWSMHSKSFLRKRRCLEQGLIKAT